MNNTFRLRTKEEIERIRNIGLKNKGKIFTEEQKKRMSESHKGQKAWNKDKKMSKEFIKKISDTHWSKKPERNEVIEKMRKAKIGKKHTEEHNKKISLSNKGRIILESTREKIRKKLIGIPLSDIRKKRISKANKGKHNSPKNGFKKGCIPWNKGKHYDIENDGQFKKRYIPWNKGKKYPKELYPNYGIRKIRNKLKIPKRDTSIELKIQGFLTLLKIEYITHKYISEIEHHYCCDIFIPSINLVIECDGDYFHGSKQYLEKRGLSINQRQIEQKQRDEIRTKELQEKGFRVIRLWEHEINSMDLNNFKEIMEIQNV